MSHNTLSNGEWLLFKMQGDGKIAVYWGGQCRFQNTAVQRPNIKGIKMQEDSNLCMYTGSTGNSPVICAVQNDINVVLYKGTLI
ncbi:uncharacterized protein BDR25DRAFT_307479 [Lindgomyces ingoldianus]|uniref:Uncharacterized protein n=1 Tax=Lindgomyces ingoldianus TaxID=673940 RepID=A0ACB6QCR6_9PLEO|nr:uncharacterized protein BDR25DRAFT_307479 [Lindgomyces ingoldianus]KAF2463941.1 hypothetical protein BDR25DRAFT_307479 [Lindgomyces ingoldianus]